MEAIEEFYIKELCQGYSEYDNCPLIELIEHVKIKYAMLDDHVLGGILAVFAVHPTSLCQWTCTTAGLPLNYKLGPRWDDVITWSDFKSETIFGFLSPNYTGQHT